MRKSGDNYIVEQEKTTTIARPNRDKLLGGLRKRGADLPDDIDDEELIGEAMARHKEVETARDGMVADNSLILDLIADNPDAKDLVDYMIGQDENGNGRLAKALKDRRANSQEGKALVANLEKSFTDNVVPYLMEQEATTEEQQAVFEAIGNILAGNISRDITELIFRGIRYDEDTQNAMEIGSVRGKNENIDLAKARLRGGDELPRAKSSVSKPMNNDGSILGLGQRLDPTKIGLKRR